MKQDDIYTDNVDWSLGKQVKDFLPSPSQLVRKQEMQRVTMEVPKETINFFKQKAREHGGSYQLMIREIDAICKKLYNVNDPNKDKNFCNALI